MPANSNSKKNLNLSQLIGTGATFGYLIFGATRITTDTATLIDHVFTNSFSKFIKASISYSDISDHLPVAVQ